MKTVHKSVLVSYSPQEMFDLVTNVVSYPQFLPWCDHAAVRDQGQSAMTAEIGISFAGIHKTFVTRNTHETGKSVTMALVQGPFSHLDGGWRFHPVGDGAQRACKVELDLRYGFSSRALAMLVGPVFDRIAGSLVEAFVARAEKVYG